MDKDLKDVFISIMFDTCRNQMDEIKNYGAADAGEKVRQCYSKFYKLIRHQNDYYENLSQNQLNDILNG